MKTCPKCKKEYPDKAKFCLEDGTLLEEKASGLTAMSGGKIVAGGDVTQNVSHHSETNVYNQDESKQVKTCVVSGRKAVITEGNDCKTCGEWALNEHFDDPSGQCRNCSDKQSAQKANDYRSAVLDALNDDFMIDADERVILDSLSAELGISNDRARQIEEEIRDEISSHSAALGPSDQLLFKRSEDSLYLKGDVSKAFGNLGILVESYPEHKEIARMYVLCAIEADPELGLEFLSRSPCFREDSARKSLRKIELYEKLGKTAEAKAEEKRALQAFADDSLIKAKALERMIDLYLEDEQEEEELDAVKEVGGTWEKPGPEDEPYLHFVDAYLGVAMKEESELQPEGGGPKANYFCSRKLRLLPDLYKFQSDFDAGMRLAKKEKWEEAVECFERAADDGYAEAQNKLAEMYYEGVGVEQDHEEAFKWFRESACLGDATGQKELGVMYYQGEGVEQDLIKSIKWFEEAAQQDHVEAQRCLAEMYYDGEGVEQDLEEAYKWFRESALQGDAIAQNKLGDMYYDGEGVEQDHEEAYKWFREAASQGDATGQKELGVMYYHGEGVEQDHAEAYEWFKKAAEQGNIEAQRCLAEMYYDGEGVEQDHEEAYKWFREAALQGDASAQNKLGDMYYEGEGVDQDLEEAFKWFEKAAQKGHAEAQKNLAVLYFEGEGVEQDHVNAFGFFKEAAEQGRADAQFYLAEMYNAGEGVHQNHGKALNWMRKAAGQGHEEAQDWLRTDPEPGPAQEREILSGFQGRPRQHTEKRKKTKLSINQDEKVENFNERNLIDAWLQKPDYSTDDYGEVSCARILEIWKSLNIADLDSKQASLKKHKKNFCPWGIGIGFKTGRSAIHISRESIKNNTFSVFRESGVIKKILGFIPSQSTKTKEINGVSSSKVPSMIRDYFDNLRNP